MAGAGAYSGHDRVWDQPGGARFPSPSEFKGEKAVTAPSYDAIMGFPFPAMIKEVLVKDGDAVTRGQLLVRALDDDAAAAVELSRIQAESNLQIEYARKAFELAEIEMNKYKAAREGQGSSELEYERARLAWETKRIELDLAGQRKMEGEVRLKQAEAELARYRLTSEVDGQVKMVRVRPGHSLNESEPVIQVVDIDPMRIDVPTPTGQTMALGLKEGSPAWVLLGMEGMEWRVLKGAVYSMDPTADAASNTRRVTVELPNPDLIPPGMTVWVRFTEPDGPWRGVMASREGGTTP